MRWLALVVALSALASTARAQQPASDEARHVLSIRYADRPLTLPEGTFRLDQSVVLRLGSGGFGISGPNALFVGVTDWLEVGVTWPWTRDPGLLATARIAHSGVVDLGLRVQATLPAVTTGDTNLVVSMPIVFRLAHVARIATGVTGDFVLAQALDPVFRIPLSIVFSPSDRHFVGLDGSFGISRYRFAHGGVAVFYGHTAATPLRPFGELRIGFGVDFSNGGTSPSGDRVQQITFSTYVAFSFWTTVNPIAWP